MWLNQPLVLKLFYIEKWKLIKVSKEGYKFVKKKKGYKIYIHNFCKNKIKLSIHHNCYITLTHLILMIIF